MSSLNQAHKGYNYQDLATACAFARSLVIKPEDITVDKKKFAEDIFDDLRLRFAGNQEAYQFKFSEDPDAKFTISDLNTSQRDLRIDHIVNSFLLDPDRFQTSYFIVTTLQFPDDELSSMLLPLYDESIFGGTIYKLDPAKLWPNGGVFQWKLRNAAFFNQNDLYELLERLRLVFGASRPSFDLRAPGAQESELFTFLKSEVGVGYYPNQDKNEFDISCNLLNFATRSRQNSNSVTVDDISQFIQLRVDFGKITQHFPVDSQVVIKRKTFLDEFLGFIGTRRVSVLTGSPGMGKSWFIGEVISTLRNRKSPVIYHYCYVSPFDDKVRDRISENVLYGNLVSELLKVAPHLRGQHRPFYSATRESFESLLERASEDLEDIYIIVDGLDHINRVLHQHPQISSTEARILEEIESMSLPDRVHLVLSTQPGPHISSFVTEDNTISMRSWGQEETSGLLKRKIPAIADMDLRREEIAKRFQEKSAGNPLYLTYLINDLSECLKNDTSLEIETFLEYQVTLEGDIAVYYEHLFSTVRRQRVSEAPARLLGLVEFALKDKDISDILGKLAAPLSVVKECLGILRPVLTNFESQGGYRIYHESFRRFVFDKLAANQIELKEALAPIIQWLENQGFYKDTIAFRHLLPLLLRSKRGNEALEKISLDFVVTAIQHGHNYESINDNLLSAIDTCEKIEDLPKMIILWELRRMLYEVFEVKFANDDLRNEYNICLGIFSGWSSLRDSLLYEGIPVLDRKAGLLACRACDENAVVPPWREYLILPDKPMSDEHHERDIEAEISNFIGHCRTNPKILDQLKDYLAKNEFTNNNFLRQIIGQASRVFGADIISGIIENAEGISQEHKASSYIALAQGLKNSNDTNSFQRAELRLIELCSNQSFSKDLISLGLDLRKFQIRGEDITQFNIGLNGDLHSIDEVSFQNWLNAIIVTAFQRPKEIEAYVSTIFRNSWYYCWLCFVGQLFLAISDQNKGERERTEKILSELRLLSEFAQPFAGMPRACDLYSIRDFIHWSFELALSNLQYTIVITHAIESLIHISKNSTVYLQRSPGGPLVHSELIDIAIKTIKDRDLIAEVSPLLSTLICETESGEYYDTLAEHQFSLARLQFSCGDNSSAFDAYKKGCFYLTCYGQRKDPTIYELIDSMQAVSFDSEKAIQVANKTLSILRAVQVHTDGKNTSRVFVSWFNRILFTIQESALVLLGDTISSPTGFASWQAEDCIENAIANLTDRLDPVTFMAVELGLRVDDGFEINESRMTAVLEFLEDATLSQTEKGLLTAHLVEDSHTRKPDWILRVSENLQLYGQQCNAPEGIYEKQTEDRCRRRVAEDEKSHQLYKAMMRGNSASSLRYELRKIQSTYLGKDSMPEDVVNAIGYRLCELLDKGDISTYREIVLCLDEELSFSSRAQFWEYLADGLERFGYKDEAAEAYVISHCRSKGNGGWLVLGDDETRGLLQKAISIAPEVASKRYIEILKDVSKGVANASGFSRHVIEDLTALGKKEIACTAWENAFDLISNRLPSTYASFGPFSGKLENVMSYDFDSAMTYLICCRLNNAEKRRKLAAMSAMSQLVENAPQRLIQPLKRLMTMNSTVFTLAIVLRVIEEYETVPYVLSSNLRDELSSLVNIEHFFISETARLLLARIGVSVPDVKIRINGKQLIMPPNLGRMNYLDWGNRLALIQKSIPDLTSALMFEFSKKTNSENFKSIMKNRDRYYSSRGRSFIPKTPSIGWEQEEFDRLLNQMLARHFWGSGSADLRERIRYNMLPVIEDIVENWNARLIRPDRLFPSQMNDDDDNNWLIMPEGEYKNWIILGWKEEQLDLDNNGSYKGKKKE